MLGPATVRTMSAALILMVSLAACGASGEIPAASGRRGPATAPPVGVGDAAAAPMPAGPPSAPIVRSVSPVPPAPASPLASSAVGVPSATPPPWFSLHVPILMYHRVAPAAQSVGSLAGLVVDPAVFARQMDALAAAGWRTITVAELSADLAAGRAPPARTVVLTFDDGHADGYTHALPVLLSHGFVATYYVVTGRIGEPGELTADQVRALAAAGMEIGDHTVRHVDLAALPVADQRAEVTDAADAIAAITGARPVTFAYPFGDLSGTTVGIVDAAGFGIAVTNRGGVFESWANRLLVPRIEIGPGVTGDALVGLLAPFARD